MKIKTVTTVEGINSIDFGDNTPRFYWFKNLGDSTLYVSAKPSMIAGEFTDILFSPTAIELYIESDDYLGKCYSTIRYTKG